METERLRTKGRLFERREDAANLKLKMEGLRDTMRVALDEFAKIDKMNFELVASLAIDARNAQIDYAAAQEEIAAMERALGIGHK